MTRSDIRRRPATRANTALAAALLMLTCAPLCAQRNTAAVPEPSPLMRKMADEIGQSINDYWLPRLGEYTTRIDSLLAPNDRTILNHLRARWTILMDNTVQKFNRMAAIKAGDTSAGIITGAETSRAKDVVDIYAAIAELSARYRPGLDRIGATVVGDLNAFMSRLSNQIRRFAEEHGDSIASDPQLKMMLGDRKGLQGFSERLISGQGKKGFADIYNTVIEPVILLYDGTGIETLRGATGSVGIPTSSIGGLPLPEMPVLRQNVPNPASSTTTIPYLLSEPSSVTLMRIYNAAGNLVAIYDQGSRPAGQNALDLDISQLPDGTYLYHLTVHTANGNRVYARTMVVKKGV